MPRGGRRDGAGRPPGARNRLSAALSAELSELARAHTADAIEALVSIMADKGAPANARVTAACALLDRGHGKPAVPVISDGPGMDLSGLTERELEFIVALHEGRVGEWRAGGNFVETGGQVLTVGRAMTVLSAEDAAL